MTNNERIEQIRQIFIRHDLDEAGTMNIDAPVADLYDLITEARREGQQEEIKHWLGVVAWPNTYRSMQEEMKKRLASLDTQAKGEKHE